MKTAQIVQFLGDSAAAGHWESYLYGHHCYSSDHFEAIRRAVAKLNHKIGTNKSENKDMPRKVLCILL